MAPGPFTGSLCREFALDVMRREEYCQEWRCEGKHSYGRDLNFRSRRDRKGSDPFKGKNPSIFGTCNLNGLNEKMQVMVLDSKRLRDLEPGELCSEDSSGIEYEFKGSGGMDEASSGKKRKLSPIERGTDQGKKNINFRQNNRNNERAPVALQSHAFLTIKSSEPNSTKRVRKTEDLMTYQRISADFIQGLQLENGDGLKDCAILSTISSSKRASGNGSFQDNKGSNSDMEHVVNRRKDMLLASAQDQRTELTKVIFRGVSERSVSTATDSVEPCKEDFLEPMKGGIYDVDVYEVDSDIEENNYSIEEGCNCKTLGYVESPCRSIDMLQACRSVDDFDKLNRINEGAYGTVYRAKDKKTGEIVALKKVKMQNEREGFPMTSLREINILLSLHHSSIVEVKEVVVGRDLDDIFIVMEYMEHDLKGLLETMKNPFHLSEVKCLMLQLLTGVKHLHDNWVLHRDLKTSNLLFNNNGELKICDFGLSRQYGSPLEPYTKLVVTLWYRAPELLLGANEYSTAIDMWSVGCLMAELLNKEPLFPGKSELDQLDKIFRILGTPNEDIWPGLTRLPGAKAGFVKKPFKLHEKFPRKSPTTFLGQPMLSNVGFDLLNKLLTYDPEMRITAEDALDHPWFCESPLPMSKDFMPTFPAHHRKDRIIWSTLVAIL